MQLKEVLFALVNAALTTNLKCKKLPKSAQICARVKAKCPHHAASNILACSPPQFELRYKTCHDVLYLNGNWSQKEGGWYPSGLFS